MRHLFRSALFVLTLALLASVAPAGPARAAGGLPLALFDQPSVGWLSIRNMSAADHQSFFESQAAAGMLMIDAERLEIGGQLRVSSVWQRNSDNRGWASRSNLTSQQFADYWQDYLDAGYRLIDQDAYPIGGELRYAGIWVENRENLDWASYRNLTSQQFADYFDELSRDGFILVDTEAYSTAGGLLYSQIWVQNSGGLGWAALRNMTSAEYAAHFEQYAEQGYRVHDLESYQVGTTQRYAAIWVQNSGGRGWYAYRDMTAQQYGNRWLELRDAGYRLTDFEVYETSGGVRYAGIWRQNSDRPAWRPKAQIDRLLEAYMDENDIAGLGVAIGAEGRFRYLRGFGHADIANNRVFHSGTIARAASGCKAVAGALAMRVDETTGFDIDNLTRSYAPSLPAHHTHTVAQLLANRAGVRHYNAGADPTKGVDTQYNTALAAAGLFADDALNVAPGSAYGYSTHGYTLVGAALEGALGDPIGAILNDRLSAPFNLPTLQAEDRSLPNAQRATLYTAGQSSPVPLVPDNISWKVLGGGCEVSAHDYARFGMLLAGGDILSAAGLDRLWTRPDNLANYALGWNTGTIAGGDPVVAKGGAQAGGRSYIRIYPEQEIVIALISNQRGHNIEQLGRDIGAIILAASKTAPDAEQPAPELTTDPAQAAEPAPDPTTELGDLALGVPIASTTPPTATDPEGEPAEPPFVEAPEPAPVTHTIYLPLLMR